MWPRANVCPLSGAGFQLLDRKCGEFVERNQHFPHILAIKCPPQHFIKKFPINSLQIIKFSSFHPRPNQHFVNRPTFYQHTLLCPACKLSKWLMWGICWENVDIGHLASDLTSSLILGGENVGNMLTWAELLMFLKIWVSKPALCVSKEPRYSIIFRITDTDFLYREQPWRRVWVQEVPHSLARTSLAV